MAKYGGWAKKRKPFKRLKTVDNWLKTVDKLSELGKTAGSSLKTSRPGTPIYGG
jgi:hypothetical protein